MSGLLTYSCVGHRDNAELGHLSENNVHIPQLWCIINVVCGPLGAVLVVQSDSCRKSGPVVPLLHTELAFWISFSTLQKTSVSLVDLLSISWKLTGIVRECLYLWNSTTSSFPWFHEYISITSWVNTLIAELQVIDGCVMRCACSVVGEEVEPLYCR